MQQTEVAQHTLTCEECKRITASAIESVDGFSPKQIILTYPQGKIIIAGNNLKIVNFSKTTGLFCATGEIDGVKYGEKPTKFLQKIFK